MSLWSYRARYRGTGTDLSKVPAFKRHEEDCGSTEVQIARISARVIQLTSHLKEHRKDYAATRGLVKLLGQRRRLMTYIYKESRCSFVLGPLRSPCNLPESETLSGVLLLSKLSGSRVIHQSTVLLQGHACTLVCPRPLALCLVPFQARTNMSGQTIAAGKLYTSAYILSNNF